MHAIQDVRAEHILVHGHVREVPSIRLAPGLALSGADEVAGITFASGADGLQLTSDNMVHRLSLHSAPERRALFNDSEVESLGRIELRGVTTTGRVQILARNRVRGGHLDGIGSTFSRQTRGRNTTVPAATASR